MWRQKNRVGLSFCALALAAVVAAGALLAFATGGNAASSKACTQTGSTANDFSANCVVVSVAPIVLSTNKVGVAAVKFKNVFNKATATHTVVGLDLPDGITLATPAAITSSPAVTCSEQTVSCSFGSVPGGATVTMYVRFTTSLPAGSPLDPFVGTHQSNDRERIVLGKRISDLSRDLELCLAR